MKKIEELFVFVAEDEEGEGVPAFVTANAGLPGNVWMPLFAADSARVDSLRELARGMSERTGKRIRLLRFTVREELETIEPEYRG